MTGLLIFVVTGGVLVVAITVLPTWRPQRRLAAKESSNPRMITIQRDMDYDLGGPGAPGTVEFNPEARVDRSVVELGEAKAQIAELTEIVGLERTHNLSLQEKFDGLLTSLNKLGDSNAELVAQVKSLEHKMAHADRNATGLALLFFVLGGLLAVGLHRLGLT